MTTYNSQKKLAGTLFILGIIMLMFVMWVWWHFIYASPDRAFYAAVDNSLRTRSVSKLISQKESGQNLQQKVVVTLGPKYLVRGQSEITDASSDTIIKSESVGTPKDDYIRYTKIQTSQKSPEGKTPNFSKLLNIWGKSPSSDTTSGQLYNESVLGVVPIGNLSAADRTQLMSFIKENKVYKFDEAKVNKQLVNGRPVYTYDVTVIPEAYVGMIKQFAKASGLTQLQNVDPANYRKAPDIKIKISIDAWSREVAAIDYAEAGRREELGSYGVIPQISIPEKSISIDSLQQRLQKAQ